MFDLECLCKYLWCLSPSCLISQVYSCRSAWKEIKVLPQGWFTCYTTTTDTAVYWSLFVLNILSLAVRQITLTKQRQLGQYRLWQSCLQVLVAYPCSIMSKLMLSCLFKTLCWVFCHYEFCLKHRFVLILFFKYNFTICPNLQNSSQPPIQFNEGKNALKLSHSCSFQHKRLFFSCKLELQLCLIKNAVLLFWHS